MTSTKLADGSGGRRSFEPACVRAIDAYLTLGQKLTRLETALDDLTAPGVIMHHLPPDDSLVIAIDEFATACEDTGTDTIPKKT